MKYFLILMLFYNALYAVDYNNMNSMEVVYRLNNGSETEQKNLNNQDNNFENKYFILINSYNDIIFNDIFSITSTLNYTSHPKIYSRSYNIPIESESYFELSEFMTNFYITPNDVFSAGIFSFKQGAYTEHSKTGLKQSDALMTLYCINMIGAFYTHYYNSDLKVQIGYSGRFDKIYKLPEDRYEHSRDGSNLAYLFGSYKHDKNSFKLNISTSNIMYEKIGDPNTLSSIGRLSILGIGYQYDDRDDTGNLFYSIVAASSTNFNSIGISPTGEKLSGPGFIFSNEDIKYGYSLLLGAKKDFDANIFGYDSYLGLEYFYANKNWISYVTDSNTPGNYSWGQLGSTIKLYNGVNLTPKFKIGLTGQYFKLDHAKLAGGNETIKINKTDHSLCLRLDLLF